MPRGSSFIIVGAHLDSVPEGPGINDNGSGSAVVLEAALRLARGSTQARAGVRFAFWGAEERGLIGSRHHVRYATADKVHRHAMELVALAPDVLVAATGTATAAPLLQATRTVPVVFVSVIDPLGGRFLFLMA